jgi:chromosome partitioning protein
MTLPENNPGSFASVLARHHDNADGLVRNDLPKLPRKARPGPWTLCMLGKGGSGKTTCAIQIAGIAASLGYRVLILDVDPQRSTSAWRSLRDGNSIRVHSCSPEHFEEPLERARSSAFDLVLIDNAPNWNSTSPKIAAVSNLSIVMVRPAAFDLVVGLRWVKWLDTLDVPFGVVIGAAPPRRQEQESPLVRNAREALLAVGGRVWKFQLTFRHSVIETTGTRRTLLEADPRGQAADEYRQLWSYIVAKLRRGVQP